MPTRWLKLTVAYDGTAYAGWQIQPDDPTVQAVVEAAWLEITQEEVRVTSAGRTDSGVHALGQVVGVATESPLSPNDLYRGLNAVLPDDVAIVEVVEAPDGFHATHDALQKTYRYQIHNGHTPDVFARRYSWHYPHPLDASAMSASAESLVGEHDFSSFESAGSERTDSVRTITAVSVAREGDRVMIEVTGNGFLYNMVRAIVGTLVEVGRGNRPIDWTAEVLAACDRRVAGQTAPPQGLHLVRVDY